MENRNTYLNLYNECTLCPRECHAGRLDGQKGVCAEDSRLFAARAALHMWEEPCISGKEGSGAVFFSGCSMHCVFCQNNDISRGLSGKEITVERLSDIFLELQAKKANNINLVTPTHYIPHIIEAARIAKEKGLSIPFVYNTSGYEKPETLDLLGDTVDVFLPDFKYFRSSTSASFSNALDYPAVVKKAIDKMVSLAGPVVFDEKTGLIRKGVIVRILVLPLHTKEAMEITDYLYNTYSDYIFLSIMSQYTPLLSNIPADKEFDCLRRPLTRREYEKVINHAIDIGVKNAYFQDGEVNKESFIPPFDNTGI